MRFLRNSLAPLPFLSRWQLRFGRCTLSLRGCCLPLPLSPDPSHACSSIFGNAVCLIASLDAASSTAESSVSVFPAPTEAPEVPSQPPAFRCSVDHLRPQTLGLWVHQPSVFWSFLTNFPSASDSHVGFGGGVTQCLLALKPHLVSVPLSLHHSGLGTPARPQRSRQRTSAMELSILEEPASHLAPPSGLAWKGRKEGP